MKKIKNTQKIKKIPIVVGSAIMLFVAAMLITSPLKNIAYALSISYLDKTEGSIDGGQENTIFGSGFILDEDDSIMNIAHTSSFSMVLTEFGNVFTWGQNNSGQLGTGDNTERTIPVNISSAFGGEKIVKVVGAGAHAVALSESGKLYIWGNNSSGQLGTGDNSRLNVPYDLSYRFSGEKIIDVSVGVNHSLALTESGEVYSWGGNSFGQLATGDQIDYNTPQNITAQFGSETIVRVSGYNSYSMVLAASGKLFAWGNNTYGQLGNGTYTDSSAPIDITSRFGSETIAQIPESNLHSLALMESGKVFVWGRNENGQLGDGTFNNRNTPQDITTRFGADQVVSLYAGGSHSLALTDSGRIYTWGMNNNGQLGNGSNTDSAIPVDITAMFPGSTLLVLGGGEGAHSMAYSSEGGLFAWGSNDSGQLGTGDKIDYNTPQEITQNINLITLPVNQVSEVYFGENEVTNFVIEDEGSIRVVTPAHVAGRVNVVLIDKYGVSHELVNGYEYVDMEVPNTGAK